MPHVTFVPFTGLRIRAEELGKLGMTLPGLRARAHVLSELPGLGLLTLAGMLPADWTCSYRVPSSNSEELLRTVLQDRPMLVALSALTASVEEVYAFSRQLRRAGVAVVMGGLHVTACPDEAQRICDSVVIGAGEAVWLEVLSDCRRRQLKRRYSSFTDSNDLSWPMPRFDLLPAAPPRYTLQTQRGCPLACEFCGASRLLGAFREKPVANIRRELEAINALATNPVIELADDNTFVGRRRVEEFFEVFAASGVRYFTEADWRIGTRPELLRGLAQSGCVQVLVGIESLVFAYTGMGAKVAERGRVMDAVSAIQDAGVAVNGCFIVGADGETRASIDKLVSFIRNSPFADVQLTLQTPFPGTELYHRLNRDRRLINDRNWSYYTLFDVTYRPDPLSVEQLERAFREAVLEVYSAAATSSRQRIRREVWKRNARHRLRKQR